MFLYRNLAMGVYEHHAHNRLKQDAHIIPLEGARW